MKNRAAMKQSKLWALVLAAAAAFFILTASIAVPILCRPFYYAHVRILRLAETTGWTEEEIVEAYNEMLDFCVYGTPFGTGKLAWSESGRQHFADCAALFRLDFLVLGISGATLLLGLGLYLAGVLRPARLAGHGFGFWGGLVPAVCFLILAGAASIDFDTAFVVFHKIFFPGRTNWLFDPETDEIIRILPEVFFRNCAILIVAVLLLSCAALVIADLARPGKRSGIRAGGRG